MSPLRDAVCFVHRNKRHLHCFEEFDKTLFVKQFGRNIEQFGFARRHIVHYAENLVFGECRIDVVRHTIICSCLPDSIYLIFHQRDERRHNDSDTFHKKSWKLVANGFSSASGHQHKDVLSRHQVANDCFLIVAKRVEAKILLERFV